MACRAVRRRPGRRRREPPRGRGAHARGRSRRDRCRSVRGRGRRRRSTFTAIPSSSERSRWGTRMRSWNARSRIGGVLLRLGPLIETHGRFPGRTNVQFVHADGRHDARARSSGSEGRRDAVVGVVRGCRCCGARRGRRMHEPRYSANARRQPGSAPGEWTGDVDRPCGGDLPRRRFWCDQVQNCPLAGSFKES